MSKEILLQELKDIIVLMRDHNLDIIRNPEVRKIFIDKRAYIEELSKKLSPSDVKWLETHYGKWMKEVIHPHYKDTIEKAQLHGALDIDQFQAVLMEKHL